MDFHSTKQYNNNNLSFLSSFTLSPFSLSPSLTLSLSIVRFFCMSISLLKHHLWIIASERNLIHPNNRFNFFGKVCNSLQNTLFFLSSCFLPHNKDLIDISFLSPSKRHAHFSKLHKHRSCNKIYPLSHKNFHKCYSNINLFYNS